MIEQVEFSLKPRRRGFHLITQEVASHLPVLPEKGLLHLFVKHTSCALSINENYDPSVRNDMECIYNDLEAVLISFDKFVKHDLDECNLYHSFCGFSKEFIIDGQPSEVFQ
ncbi:YjbQ family protein, partial [Bacteroides gallinaceum]|uniref:YjbQ family protein n=1 Tax=Bacteroides gallinaceum TaxID=1462571 RepID=UPI001EF53DC0